MAYSQTEYEEYLITETNTEQELNQQNTGSGSSNNINCGTNTASTNLAQPLTCQSNPGQPSTLSKDFDTVTNARFTLIEPGSGVATSEVSCPEGTHVTGGGYELIGVNSETPPLIDAHPVIDAPDPDENGWRVSINIDNLEEFAILGVYAICGRLVDVPLES